MSAMPSPERSIGLSESMPTTIEVEPLFDMHVDLAPPLGIASPAGMRMIFIAQGGVVEGERLRGELLPGGGEWLLVGTDRVGRVDVRAVIKTHDDALIHFTNRGIIDLGDDNLARFAQGESIAWDEAYIRSVPLMETGDERYGWLNSTVTVAINELGKDYVRYRVFSVK